MADAAWSPLNLCGIQVNRLDSDGTILERADGDTNVALSCALVDITRNEIVGDDVEQRDVNGSGGYAASRVKPGAITGYEYEMTLSSRIDAEMMELFGLVDRVVSGGVTIGYKAKDIVTAACDCDPTQSSQAGVSLVMWSLAWLGDAPHPDYNYIAEAAPKIVFKPGVTRQKSAEFTTTTLTGVAQRNLNWGQGPGSIYPEVAGLNRLWAEWLTDSGFPGGCNCDIHGYRTDADAIDVPAPYETAGS